MTTAIAITAHHDDAVLWCGGTILRTASLGWKWTIAALCVPAPERRHYFNEYCAAIRVSPLGLGFHDYQEGPAFSRNRKIALEEQITRACPNAQFDWVFTHSRDKNCEYSFHANHYEVSEVTRDLVATGKLCAGVQRLLFFSYWPIYGFGGLATVAKQQAAFYMQLNYDELIHKATWCKKAPGACSDLENLGFPCPNPEAFVGDGVQLSAPFIPGPPR
jgi:LmbE family N-acetylglucosaminyl deacetylase